MASPTRDLRGRPSNPLDIVEELVCANEWRFNRHSDRELMVEIAGRWCGHNLFFLWRPDIDAMFLSCHLDQRVPETRRAAVYELLAAVNEDLWLGHFDLVKADGATLYRHTIPLRGSPGLSAEQLEDLIDAAIIECERFYPALQLILWGGRSVPDALAVARMDTVAEA